MITIEQLYEIYLAHPVICTDTRKITPDCIFVALRGENFNGNQFAGKAIDAGAAFVIVDDPEVIEDQRYLLVDNALKALQDLASFHRSKLNIPFIGITGTNGKTTTKELISSVLSTHFNTYATQGNLNNHIGVPLTILSITAQTEIAIIEMGANHVKEIGFLCGIAKPTHGLITNVGKAHLEGFGSFEGVKKGKGELYQYLSETGGLAFINRDNHFLIDMARDHQVSEIAYYGTGSDNYISGKLLSSTPLTVAWHKNFQETDAPENTVESNLSGSYNLENILAAICVGSYFKLSDSEIIAGISGYFPVNNRSQLKKTDKNLLICDYYNANPSSMAVALENLTSMKADNKVFILGDMFELGQDAFSEHQALVNRALTINAERRIFVGSQFYVHKSPAAEFYTDTEQAKEALRADPVNNSTVLIKGSRGMKFETIVELL